MSKKKLPHQQRQPKASRPFMSGFRFPKGVKGLLPWKWADRRLKKSHHYWLATTWPDGRPHVMVVWGLWLEGAFYFSTGRQSRKGRNLEANPYCVVCTEQADEAVILEGTARVIPEGALVRKILSLYKRKYRWDPTSLDQPMYSVRPSTLFGLDEKRGPEAATRWKFPA